LLSHAAPSSTRDDQRAGGGARSSGGGDCGGYRTEVPAVEVVCPLDPGSEADGAASPLCGAEAE